MNIPLNKAIAILAVSVVVTGAIGYVIGTGQPVQSSGTAAASDSNEPLYWVAPMDPNYRRDQPGKSPMGMDLIPVYEDAGEKEDAGTVRISADVVNNLGVRTALVSRGTLDRNVATVGYVQYDEDRLLHIHPRVEGWIETLYVKAAGDPVVAGEPLYALYSPALVNAQEELLLALKRNSPALIAAATERLSALQVPDSEIRRLKSTRQVSQTITLLASQSGVLDALMVREGMYVKPGMEMMSIGQPQHIWVIGEVFERQAALVRQGDAVQMTLDYLPGRLWQGQVDYVYPTLDSQTRTVKIRIHVDNPDGYLKPGMFARLRIAARAQTDTLLIPREALIRTGHQNRVVLAKGEGRFKSVAVTPGIISEEQVEILSGLEDGDRIVTSAQFLIDSESSKTSDFVRMDHGADDAADSKAAPPQTVSVAARVEAVMAAGRTLNLTHDAIAAWNWPAMTMDFNVADGVDLEGLKPGMALHITIRKEPGGGYVIRDIHRLEDASESGVESMDHGTMDHGSMDDSSMDHSSMDHGSMDHGSMDHSTMDHNSMEMDHSQHSMEGKP